MTDQGRRISECRPPARSSGQAAEKTEMEILLLGLQLFVFLTFGVNRWMTPSPIPFSVTALKKKMTRTT